MEGKEEKGKKDERELLRQQFIKATGGGGGPPIESRVLTCTQFQRIMGILGLESASFVSDRIFNAIDKNGDKKMQYGEFLETMEMLASGSQEQKSEFGFRILDLNGQGQLKFEEFKQAINEIVRLWYALTGSTVPLTDEVLQELFNRIDEHKKGYIVVDDYFRVIKEKIEFIPWFDLLNTGQLRDTPTLRANKEQMTYQLDTIKQQLIWLFQSIGTLKKGEGGEFVLPPELRNSLLDRAEYSVTAIMTVKDLMVVGPKKEQASPEHTQMDNILSPSPQFNPIGVPHLVRSFTTVCQNKTKNEDTSGFVNFMDANWNLVLHMMLGIRNAIKSLPLNAALRQLSTSDFAAKINYELVHLRTEKERENAYRFVDYSGFVFQAIREIYGIKNEDYLREIGLEQLIGNLMVGNLSSLKEQCSCGKSGSFFYYSSGGRFLMKTIPRGEFLSMRNMMGSYYKHMVENPNTLITRFFGLHKIQNKKKKTAIYFVIMANVFNTSRPIHVRYDLKGSTINREVRKFPGQHIDSNISLKDIDFDKDRQKLEICDFMKRFLLLQLELDSVFLKDQGICDYSLLVGVHNFGGMENIPEINAKFNKQFWEYDALIKTPVSAQGNFRLPPFNEVNDGGIVCKNGAQLFFFGIIDTLTFYGAGKKMEHYWKTIKNRKGTAISAVAPDFYAKRFVEYMNKVIL